MANVVHITTSGHMVKNTKLPILGKYGIIHSLKCPKNPGEQDTNSNSYLKLTISLMFKYYSMSAKITNQKKKTKTKTNGRTNIGATSNRSHSLTCPKTWGKGNKQK